MPEPDNLQASGLTNSNLPTTPSEGSNSNENAEDSSHVENVSLDSTDEKRSKLSEVWNVESPCTIIAVLFKEAALDSPSFRVSMNHLDTQMTCVDKWLDSFTKSLDKFSTEMDSTLNIYSILLICTFTNLNLI